ncbi:helix-turn-helix domain-containing protein [Aneurinibacillus danicus]|uniref:HTH cro/C1-type domain-containing protein n=1 Tax=Aneurinibacillus danicus TaxID=267746 RepID=A0A511V416_9BACL|nr:helix-turn-helix transcriptional regulator [Aneurinibacillus danicus]GEN33654.1 hypothetical protein ADA01nite_11140 [Aneurinibacillus danicus]
MIKCNLAVLMAERGLKIADIASGTGMSRTTISSLVNHNAKGIQYDTFNTLCEFLKVSPGELFIYEPFTFSFEVKEVEERENDFLFKLEADITYKKQVLQEVMLASVVLDMDEKDELCYVGIEVNYSEEMTQLIAPIPRMFHKDMEEEIKEAIMEKLAQTYSFAEDIVVTLK